MHTPTDGSTPPSIAVQSPDLRAGYIALIGPTNAGKSRLFNELVAMPLAIVTQKVQTTRNNLCGVRTEGPNQMLFVDTAGLFEAETSFERMMTQSILHAVHRADVILVVVDAKKGIDKRLRETLGVLKRHLNDPQQSIKQSPRTPPPIFLLLNKIDLVRREALLPLTHELNAQFEFQGTYMVSAKTNSGIDQLLTDLVKFLPQNSWIVGEDQISLTSDAFILAEITRSNVMLRLHQEIPYGTMVETESLKENARRDLICHQVIYTDTESHRKMILGKSGTRIKAVRIASQAQMRALYERDVHLFITVKWHPNWKTDADLLQRKVFYPSLDKQP